MRTSFIIIDDFLNEAEQLREAALQLDYPTPPEQTNFPGRNSTQRINITGLDNAVSALAGERLTPAPGTAHAKCRLTLAGDEGRANIHVDPGNHWSGILYLNLPEHCAAQTDAGTDFFHHLPTGTERLPLDREELHALGFASVKEASDAIFRDTRDMSKWRHIMRAPMRFNRLVLLRPWFWHTASPGFGDSLANGRLVYLLFYNTA